MPIAMILLWCKNNWQLVAIGLLALAAVTYVGVLKFEVSHYKSKYEAAEAELASAVKREELLTASVNGITTKYENTMKAFSKTLSEKEAILEERILRDEELRHLRISYAAVGLFNQSKRNPSGTITQAIKGNDGATRATITIPASDGSESRSGTVPLSEIFALVAKNDANHWKCVNQVETWQHFWIDYEGAVERAGKVK